MKVLLTFLKHKQILVPNTNLFSEDCPLTNLKAFILLQSKAWIIIHVFHQQCARFIRI
jgi:hypothetical protein